jgi:hypothetical protein
MEDRTNTCHFERRLLEGHEHVYDSSDRVRLPAPDAFDWVLVDSILTAVVTRPIASRTKYQLRSVALGLL